MQDIAPIRPVDLPELRSEVLHFQAQHGPAFYDLCIRAGKMPVRPRGPIHEAAIALAKMEAERVMKGQLFYVDANLVHLAKQAAMSLPKFTLAPEDLPAPWGFMVFGASAYSYTNDEGPSHLRAVAWGPWSPGPGWKRGGIWVSWYSDRDLNLEAADLLQVSEADRHLWRTVTPRLNLDLEDQYPFHDEPLPALNPITGQACRPFGEGEDEGLDKSNFLRVVWLLMQQPLAEVDDVQADRAARKRLRRAGHEAAPVRVIDLRRPKHSGTETGKGRDYQHQWIVRGHWRQQWFPARQVHRPVWIAPHIKGPEGAPLIGGEKVYAARGTEGER